jgi:DNA invertase Pin-like site-specific DNA recombinase
MIPTSSIPAAQYLRASTDRQEYSISYQTQTIANYAEKWGFRVVETYSDPGTSGVVFRKRTGLQKLIRDIVQGQACFQAVLVYDVSRWGRFQDTDESAHYEYLCKSAGVRVHYCAESFSNDDSLPSSILKSLKRAMAGEYSRELGNKVAAGQQRGASLGFRQGGQPGYGLRRLLLNSDGTPKHLLSIGERKSLISERVTLVRGPSAEIRCIREIYKMFIQQRMSYSQIARELLRRRIPYVEGSKWGLRAVKEILTHPKYVGTNVYGRNTQRLYTPIVPKPKSEWIVMPDSFEKIVDLGTYAKAQRIIQKTTRRFPRNWTDLELLDALRKILAENGRVTTGLVTKSRNTPSVGTYRARFGSLTDAYKLINYDGFWRQGWLETRKHVQALRTELMTKIVALMPEYVSIQSQGGSLRTRLQIANGQLISVLACRAMCLYKDTMYWLLKPPTSECQMLALVARLSPTCDTFIDIFVTPPIGKSTSFYIRKDDGWLQRCVRLKKLGDFIAAVEEVQRRMHSQIGDEINPHHRVRVS